jgi:hypothetical protein
MNRVKPSFWSAFALTEVATIFSVILIIANVLALVAWFLTQSKYFSLDLVKFNLIMILYFLIWSVWKYAVLYNIFVTGFETSGKVIGIYFWMGMQYVTYEYLYSDRIYRSTEVIHIRGKAKELNTGQQVILFVNPGKPLQVFNRDLYL